MKNIKELRDNLAKTYEELQKDEISLKKARELAYTANVLLNTIKTELKVNDAAGIHTTASILNFKQ